MLRTLVALASLVALAGCAAPEEPADTAAIHPTRSDPFATPATASPVAMTPSALPPPAPPEPQTGFTLRIGAGAEGAPVFLGADGSANPTLVVAAGAEITIELVRGGALHAFTVNGDPVIGAGSDDERGTFRAPQGGSVEYDCPIHPQSMRGLVQVA